MHTVVTLVLDPLWFLCVFAGLTALTPLAVALVRRLGAWAALLPAALVAGVDAARFGLGGPGWLGWLNVGAGWLVPYLLGIAWARGSFRGWRVPAALLAGGVAATAALVTWAGYPASMVGVNGAAHLQPEPAHAGRGHLRHRPGRPRPAAAAGAGPADAPPAGLGRGRAGQPVRDDAVPLAPVRVPGGEPGRIADRPAARPAHRPATPLWIAERLAWLPVFAAALAVAWLLFHRAEHGRAPRWLSSSGGSPRNGGLKAAVGPFRRARRKCPRLAGNWLRADSHDQFTARYAGCPTSGSRQWLSPAESRRS